MKFVYYAEVILAGCVLLVSYSSFQETLPVVGTVNDSCRQNYHYSLYRCYIY